ncbi:DEAD/DEAH box helicase family protein [Sphingomonas aerolata]|uniref:DEAD/DEAH box helicase family protein n=1 Tax=Sphingomonas aerolata TaxID=185951 RepID=UPI00141ADC06|nr:DEAD/DEAH box helicase family protein [Sphingomonas aerolata]NII59999.1 superfamily II DNA or RNA helicase [Sphingomonas aerolata]
MMPHFAGDQAYEARLSDALRIAEPIYILPKDDVAADVIIPALAASSSAEVMIGFFSSQALAEIAPGLASYLRTTSAPLRLVVSPYLSNADQDALRRGTDPAALAGEKLGEALPDADALANHALTCLAWLIAQGRLEMKIALMRDALFHPKVWLFHGNGDVAALHGSANMTGAGLGRNREQLSLARNWTSDDAARTCARLSQEFDLLWSGGDNDCVVVDLPKALEERLLRDYKGDRLPDEDDYCRLWRKTHGLPEASVSELHGKRSGEIIFAIPEWLDYKKGDYAHQGEAVDAWKAAGWRGILEMCTGSGKTLTAMIGAYQLHNQVGPLLIVVAAPYNVLVQQWCGEVGLFGLRAVDLTAEGGPKGRERAIADARRRLRLGLSPAEALVTSNDTLSTPEFVAAIAKHDGPKLLIADECHNLGAAGFASAPPSCFDYRLGLSATPVRQYDNDGTAALFGYFGPTCFSFTLEEAIGRCLTPYDYHPHFISLNDLEMAEWRDLSDQIARLAWKLEAGVSDARLERLLLSRRRVLETAAAKLTCLAELLDRETADTLRYTLVYATDKDPLQLEQVNALLAERNISFHQLTATETANPKTSTRILARFQSGALQVLTAKRVLDEGVNVPQIERAFILASTTVRRQWVQRRGRLLRMCKEIGKTHAVIHDLVTLPPGAVEGEQMDSEAKKVVRSELDRVWEFARLSRNGARTDGPFAQVERLRAMLLSGT